MWLSIDNVTTTHEDAGFISGLTQSGKDLVLQELWCRSQTWLRSGTAVAVASGYISDSTPSLGTSICLLKKKRLFITNTYIHVLNI